MVLLSNSGVASENKKVVRSARADAGTQWYRVGADTPRFLATSLGAKRRWPAASIRKASKGLGIGLSLVSQLTSLHDFLFAG